MNRFLGNIEAKLDAKGRVFIPAPFRKKLVPPCAEAGAEQEACTVILRKDIYQPCIVLYPEDVWAAEMDRLSARLNPYNATHRMLLRQFVSEAEQAVLDPNGRILISRRMLQSTGLGDALRFIGMGETIEVWDAKSTATPFLSPEEMTQKMNEILGGDLR
ncbi:MAG: division/cell wall cluster transcriptional repressor MraZ [Bacteroidaceae bacterium]